MTDKAIDKIDAGCELEQMQRDIALKNHIHRPQELSNGFCIDCGDAISTLRLHANPYAQRCIECQELHEIKKKQGIL